MENLAQELLKIRKMMGLNQTEMAKKFGVAQRTWSSYETGRSDPPMEIIVKLQEMGHTIPGFEGSAETAIKETAKITGLTEAEVKRQALAHLQELAKNFPLDTPIDKLPKPNYTPPPETEASAEPPADLSAKEKANTRAAITMLENAAQSIQAAVKLLKESMGE